MVSLQPKSKAWSFDAYSIFSITILEFKRSIQVGFGTHFCIEINNSQEKKNEDIIARDKFQGTFDCPFKIWAEERATTGIRTLAQQRCNLVGTEKNFYFLPGVRQHYTIFQSPGLSVRVCDLGK